MEIRKRFKELDKIPEFQSKITDEAWALTTDKMDVLQINVGRLCNMTCRHCHVEAGPTRTEVMSREVLEACLQVAREQNVETVDITGGAPEMSPDFRWFIGEITKICPHVIVRTNLAILTEPGYEDLVDFYAENKINVVCSLPHYKARNSEKQRGEGTFLKSIDVLKKLNEAGYGEKPGLLLDIVYNPGGAFFSPDQTALEKEYKEKLGADYGVVFNHLFTITNNPIGRFGGFLIRTGNFESYMDKLYRAFNPGTIEGMMCRFQISVAWDGTLYDCDFNQAIELPICTKETIFDWIGKPFQKRKICFDKHCYACTAGQGSSCGGATE